MRLNADFNKRAVVHSATQPWQDSPMRGVLRRPLDRVGGEVARVTSIVKYAPGSKFSPHTHTGGEEFLVIDGVFQDEHGNYPAGSYIRNPPGTSHTPGSDEGCVIFVKLWQFEPDDRAKIKLNTNSMQVIPHPKQAVISVVPLFSDKTEEVSIQIWQAEQLVELKAEHGIELLVLEGSFEEGDDTLTQQSWLRLPAGTNLRAQTESNGARVWSKRNHLARVNNEIQRVTSIS